MGHGPGCVSNDLGERLNVVRFFEEDGDDLDGCCACADDHDVFAGEVDVGAPAGGVEDVVLEVVLAGDGGGPRFGLDDDAHAADDDFGAELFLLGVDCCWAASFEERLAVESAQFTGAGDEVVQSCFPFCVGLDSAEFDTLVLS